MYKSLSSRSLTGVVAWIEKSTHCHTGACPRYPEFNNIMKQNYVYILASRRNGTLYIGVTSNIIKRTYEHKHKIIKGFSSKYNK